ncbi:acetyl-CoA synthetase-like protein [Daedalea quercina L-15889]|uniref:Acetyl-CoA synthetase-like protein n=1 Tax=Daedalea quercina L-15889 TaxID=1314783 RepID=A0A165TBH6_9APHY|nr:acetyl-CoA synthetase-like protein [Daedalea quercina L-15889]
MSLPPTPHTQCLSCSSFKVPPLDGSLMIPQIYDWHQQQSSAHRVFVYAEDDQGPIRTISWSETSLAIARSYQMVHKRLAGLPEGSVIGILSGSDSIPYVTFSMGLMRANYVPFLMSNRNSPAAVAHLLSKVDVKHLVIGREQAMHDLAQEAFALLNVQNVDTALPETSSMPVFDELFTPASENSLGTNLSALPYRSRGADAPALILHSSGSTAFPKPVTFSHQRLLQIARAPFYGQRDLTDKLYSLHAAPMFHALGIIHVMLAMSTGIVLTVFAPRSPAVVPTTDTAIHGAMTSNCDILVAVPAMIEAWSRNPDYVNWLKTRTGILYSGGPLNKGAGDFMVSNGVTIFCLYGSTESGGLSVILPAGTPKEWEYFEIAPHIGYKMQHFANNEYEFIHVANETMRPNVINTQVDGMDAYATSDLLVPHPTKKGFWKVFGRTDDQIMHSTGEKTNPGPLEAMMNQDPHVSSGVMFGRGRFQAGIIVDPKPQYAFDPSDETKLAEFRNKIWPTIEKMNAYAPQHSRLFKEMIMVSKPSKPFLYTPKHTVRRAAVVNLYEEDINLLYKTVEASAQSNIPPPAQWDAAGSTDFVRRVVWAIMTHKVAENDDVFQHGCDSLQATHIRNTILQALREDAKVETRNLSSSFVYEHPTVSALGAFVSSVALGTANTSTSPAARVEAMQAMVAKYSSNFPVHKTILLNAAQPVKDVVLLTGTTGALGSHLLVKLAKNPEVKRVYALNRASRGQVSLRERQAKVLAERGLDASILDTDKVVLVEGDLTQQNFGLTEDVYKQMHHSVTHIIHNAWKVDFAINLPSFEPQVQGVRSLIDFALTSHLPSSPRVLFTSSMATLQNAPADQLCPESPVDPFWTDASGYAESKWVSEQILYAAAAQAKANTLVVRVGQVCGGPDGIWNASEWYPALVQSASKLGCYPDDDKVRAHPFPSLQPRRSGTANPRCVQAVNWIPLDIATDAITEFRRAPDATHTVNLAHPRPAPWHTLAQAASDALSVPIVPFPTWLEKLEAQAVAYGAQSPAAQAETIRGLRALHLLPMFRGMLQKEGKAKGRIALAMADMDVRLAQAASPTLADPAVRQLSAEDVKRWVAYWRKVGLLQA